MKMRTAILISIMMVMLPIGTYAQYDDMYFVPKKEEKKAESKEIQPVSSGQEVRRTSTSTSVPVLSESENGFTLTREADYGTSSADERDVDEYNRRYMFYDGGSEEEEADTLYDEAEEEGEWVNGFKGSDADYQYTKRILRFYTPTVGIPVSSPLYWDLCYGPNAIYWNVYDDGFYAYAFPSSWNSLYYGPSFSWSWGWRPWGWGFSWYSGWYSPWYDPWYGPWYGYGWYHHHHYWGPHYGGGWAGRPVNRPSVRYREGYSGGRVSSVRPSRTTSGTRVTPSRSTGTRVTPSGTRIGTGTRGTSGRSTGTVVRPSGTTTRVSPSRGTVSSVRNNTPVRTTTTNTQTTRSIPYRQSTPSTVRSTPSYTPSRSSIGGGSRVSSPVRSTSVRSGRR